MRGLIAVGAMLVLAGCTDVEVVPIGRDGQVRSSVTPNDLSACAAVEAAVDVIAQGDDSPQDQSRVMTVAMQSVLDADDPELVELGRKAEAKIRADDREGFLAALGEIYDLCGSRRFGGTS